MKDFVKGQRWISEMEPELGLGIVTEVAGRRVHIHFPAAETTRQYAIQSAPVKRVRFKIGDTIRGVNGESFAVSDVSEENHLLCYLGEGVRLTESQLSDSVSFTTPETRLKGGFVDPSHYFDLRYETLRHQCRILKSLTRGFLGGRIDLIPHQIFIASEVTNRYLPRVLLADEVGLGKTIEACLILHRLLLSGRIGRILILVPESLVHQWFVELLRRFSLMFRIVDESYCLSIEETDPDVNPFLEDQLCLCSTNFLLDQAKRRKQVLLAEWDMLIIDEVHHFKEGSPEYSFIKTLGQQTPGLLLLTATPRQLGVRSHFARLQLLDPERYYNFDRYLEQEQSYQSVAGLADRLLQPHNFSAEDESLLRKIMGGALENLPWYPELVKGEKSAKEEAVGALLDQHGTGRVMFRNTRRTISGFPKRHAHLIRLETSPAGQQQACREFRVDLGEEPPPDHYDFNHDPRIEWLVQFIKKHKSKKILLICCSLNKAKAIAASLRDRINIKTTLFHEEMTLIQRDRQAAWFHEADGAQLLICSEIGSEGRNFQFAHHLVLFDLPFNPELLEQRIGRLDRIGQTNAIHIHVLFISGSPQEVFVHWIQEALNGFEASVAGVHQIFKQTQAQLKDVALGFSKTAGSHSDALDLLCETTRKLQSDLRERLEKGRDRLLELNSFRPALAAALIEEIKKTDHHRELDDYLFRMFAFFNVGVEEIDTRLLHLNFDLVSDHAFPIPALREEGMKVTFDRKTAVSREDIDFLTWDHPMVNGCMELILGSERGNSCLAVWPDAPSNEILLESVFVLECVAPLHLHIDRFFPPTPIRLVVNHALADVSEVYPIEMISSVLRDDPRYTHLDNPQIMQTLFPKMLARCKQVAQSQVPVIVSMSKTTMEQTLNTEIQRLRSLKKVNPNIREREILAAEKEKKLLDHSISDARLRLDGLRLIFKRHV